MSEYTCQSRRIEKIVHYGGFRLLKLFVAILIVAISTNPAMGQLIFHWNNTSNNFSWYDEPLNWTEPGRPSSNDVAIFDQPVPYEVWWDNLTASNTPEVGFFYVDAGEVTLSNEVALNQWILTITGALGTPDYNLSVSGQGTILRNSGIELRIDNGAEVLEGATLEVGDSASGGSIVTVSGSIGFKNNGNVLLDSGGIVNATAGYLGFDPNTTGILSVTGTSFAGGPSSWNGSSFLSVGELGDGVLQVSNGGVVSNTAGYLGYETGSHGAAYIDGIDANGNPSTWNNSSQLYVGYVAEGSLEITGGAFVSNTIGNIGYLTNATGTVTVDGTDLNGNQSLWKNNGNLYVGRIGNGVLNVLNGSRVISTVNAYIGLASTGTGEVTIDGTDLNGNPSTMNSYSDLHVGEAGDGTLNLTNGGLSVSNNALIGFGLNSNGEVQVNGTDVNGNPSHFYNYDSLSIGQEGEGTLNVSGGGLVTDYDAFVGSLADSIGIVTIDGTDPNGNSSSWNNTNALYVGYLGLGELLISNGGHVSDSIGSVGSLSLSNNTVTVDGTDSNGNPSTWSNSSSLSIADYGIGNLNVTGGGLVNCTGATLSAYTGTATVTVDGTDPAGNPSTWNVSSTLYAGYGGNAVLNISNGGLVSSASAYVGREPSSASAVTVDGIDTNGNPSAWSTSALSVGYKGDGVLQITGGGMVTDTSGTLGDLSGSTGVATVDGIDTNGNPSTWTNLDALNIGEFGDGTLNIVGGGLVSSFQAFLGRSVGSTGTATISGVDANGNPSTWNSSLRVTVGGNDFAAGGIGVLNVANQGLLVAGSSLRLWGSGTVNLDGGTIVTNRFDNTEGGTFNFLAGLLTINEGITIGSDPWGVFPGNVTLNAGQHLATPANTTISPFRVLTLDGGKLSTATLNNQGSLVFNSGTLEITGANGLTVGSGGSLGSSILLGSDTYLEVTNTLTIASGANISLSGGDVSAGFIDNHGRLSGAGAFLGTLQNNVDGEVEVLSGQQLRFAGSSFSNFGEVDNFGGQVRFEGEFFNNDTGNNDTGFVAGRGQFIADGGWINQGVMAFSAGISDVLGDVFNDVGARIITSGGATTTFFDDVIHNGVEIRTAAGSNTVFLGAASGSGTYTGTGTVYFEGDLRPGNSPGIVEMEGDVVFGSLLTSEFELGGTMPGEFDRLNVTGDLSLAGDLLISLIDGFTISLGDEFLIADVAGVLSGQFNGLNEGSLVGNFGGTDLTISYQAGDGNDIALLAAGLPGDFDFDGDRDGRDFLIWQRGGSPNPFSSSDLSDWQANYGVAGSLANSHTVPEPATLLLAAIVFVVGFRRAFTTKESSNPKLV